MEGKVEITRGVTVTPEIALWATFFPEGGIPNDYLTSMIGVDVLVALQNAPMESMEGAMRFLDTIVGGAEIPFFHNPAEVYDDTAVPERSGSEIDTTDAIELYQSRQAEKDKVDGRINSISKVDKRRCHTFTQMYDKLIRSKYGTPIERSTSFYLWKKDYRLAWNQQRGHRRASAKKVRAIEASERKYLPRWFVSELSDLTDESTTEYVQSPAEPNQADKHTQDLIGRALNGFVVFNPSDKPPYGTTGSRISEEAIPMGDGPGVYGSPEQHVFVPIRVRRSKSSQYSVAATLFSDLTGKEEIDVNNRVLGRYRDDPFKGSHDSFEHKI